MNEFKKKIIALGLCAVAVSGTSACTKTGMKTPNTYATKVYFDIDSDEYDYALDSSKLQKSNTASEPLILLRIISEDKKQTIGSIFDKGTDNATIAKEALTYIDWPQSYITYYDSTTKLPVKFYNKGLASYGLEKQTLKDKNGKEYLLVIASIAFKEDIDAPGMPNQLLKKSPKILKGDIMTSTTIYYGNGIVYRKQTGIGSGSSNVRQINVDALKNVTSNITNEETVFPTTPKITFKSK